MREIEKAFSALRERGEGALIAYVTGGDPKPGLTPKIVGALIGGGADIVEIGIPFSDPIADGPTIQAASVRALRAGATPRVVLELAREIREDNDVPIVLLTYLNPIFRMGLRRFAVEARRCRVSGLIVPDIPVEEASAYKQAVEACGIDTIFLAAPSTSVERLRRIIGHTSGFLYLVSLFGVTGARERLEASATKLIRRAVRHSAGKIPLAVGFGISKPQHVKRVIGSGADGAIVGSAFVDIIARCRGDTGKMLSEIEGKARALKAATIKRHP